MTPVLSIRDLAVEFGTQGGVVHAVDGVSYDVYPGETVGIIGESGCGKTASVLAVLGLLPRRGRVTRGEVFLQGRDLLRLSPRELRRVRGREVAMVFQDPMTSLHPLFSVGRQITEALRVHDPSLSRATAKARAAALLELVGVPEPGLRMRGYPQEWSGGMRQRAMIAMAIANAPQLLIADEPTTALDVTVQAQVFDVLRTAQRETGAAILLITHDLGVIAEMVDRVVVMYAGRMVETGDVHTIFHEPRHPYTLGLMANVPRPDVDVRRLAPIPGQPPSLIHPPPGCPFHPRCRLRRGRARCAAEDPHLAPVGPSDHRSACHFSDEMARETESVVEEIGVDVTGGSHGS